MKSMIFRLIITALCTLVLFFVSCKDKKEENTLLVTPERLEFEANDSKKEFVRVNSNINWKVSLPTWERIWITVNKESATGFYVNVEQNESEIERTGIITIYTVTDNMTAEVKVIQAGKNTLSVSTNSFTFNANETSPKTATVTTNAQNWDIMGVSADWINAVKQGNTISINPLSVNTSLTPRNATITVVAGSATSVIITVTQKGTPLMNSAYTATGTPLAVSNPAPASWSGEFEVSDELSEPYYAISNWANKILMYLKNDNGKILLDGTVVVAEYDSRYLCFAAGYYEGGYLVSKPASFQYEINYNVNTGTLNFSGTIDGRTAVVGVVGRNKITGQVETFYGDTFYSGAKLILTPKSNQVQINENKMNGKEQKFSIANKKKIYINPLEGDTKISINDVKYLH